jgi:hypothetical protein
MTTMTVLRERRTLLETGWEPSTDDGDTLLRRFVLGHVDYLDAATGPMARRLRTDDVVAVDRGRPAAFYNSATLLRPLSYLDADAVLGAVERFFHHELTATGDVMLWSAWPTPDLSSRGWTLMGHPPLMVRFPGDDLPPIPGTRVERITDQAALAAWDRIVVEGFPFADMTTDRSGAVLDCSVLGDDRFRLWLAYDGPDEDARPVAAAASFTSHGLAQFAFGVTAPGARRRGHWAALVRERLMASGTAPSVGLFNDNSRPGAEASGFWPLTRLTLWRRPRSIH